MSTRLCQRYQVTEANLALRRDFLRLDSADLRVLADLHPWARAIAPRIAREFYDHQFAFPPTRAFFEAHAAKRGYTMSQLRGHLEKAQAGYLQQIFAEAAGGGGFGPAYFERRLAVGKLHNVIDLPMKWYLGAYQTYFDLFRRHLKRRFWWRPGLRARAERAIFAVFNYDAQAVIDAFFYDYLESVGLDVTRIVVGDPLQDLSDRYAPLKDVVRNSLAELIRTSGTLADTGNQLFEESALVNQSIGHISGSAGRVVDQVHALAGQLRASVCEIEKLGANIQQVAGNADTLSASVSQTSASIEQMAATIQAVAGNVSAVSQEAGQSAQAAERGSLAVAQTIEGMAHLKNSMDQLATVIGGLGKSSAEIGAIVEVIDDIAEQTNLLALNAAIEAARAGEAGRGFAVVADEIRKLAERSTGATAEIAGLIRGIQSEANRATAATQQGNSAMADGIRLAGTAGEALDAIVQSVRQVSALAADVTRAMQEQSGAVQLITSAVVSMNALTQEVTTATRDQADSSRQVVATINAVQQLTRQVQDASQHQASGCGEVKASIDRIRQVASDLELEVRSLKEAIAYFEPSPAQPTALVPAATR
jgi:methyl-accepting chemotaxis protein